MTNENTLHGLIIKAQSGFFTVELAPRRHDAGQGLIVCQLRGKLKQGKAKGDIAALGDNVQVTVLEDGSGVIENVEENQGTAHFILLQAEQILKNADQMII